MRVNIQVPGVDASALGQGTTKDLPSFGAGWAAYALGTAINDTPTRNLFTGISDGVLLGAPGLLGLLQGPKAQISASISGTTMTVTALSGGATLFAGMQIEGSTVLPGTIILPFGTNGTTGTGGTGTYAVSLSQTVSGTTLQAWTSYLELPGFSRDIFNVSNAVTMFAVFKAPNNQSLLADGPTGGNMGMLVPASSDIQVYGNDVNGHNPNVTSASGYDAVASAANAWSLGFAQVNLTQGQTFIQRSGFARAASSISNRASGAMGSTTKKLRMGYDYVSPASMVVLCGVYTKWLTDSDKDAVFTYSHELMRDVGEVL